MPNKKILIIAGEPSGDLHASNLVKNIKALSQDIEFFGLGGGRLKREGVDMYRDMTDLALVGAVEVLRRIWKIKEVYSKILDGVDSTKPDLAILVDYPGFNLTIAKDLKKRSIPIIYYISPQVWAWNKGRIKIIRRFVDEILVFFKFEEELYKRYGVNVEYVGHPLVDVVKPSLDKEEMRGMYRLDRTKKTIAIVPGSRKIEIERLLSVSLEAGILIERELRGTQFLIAKYRGLDIDLYKGIADMFDLDIRIIDDDIYNALNVSDFAIAASGTATLEAAIIGTPMVIIYRANFITYVIAKSIANVSSLGLVNIISGEGVVPELLQFDARPQRIAEVVLGFLKDDDKREAMVGKLKKVKGLLGSPGASRRAAESVLARLNRSF